MDLLYSLAKSELEAILYGYSSHKESKPQSKQLVAASGLNISSIKQYSSRGRCYEHRSPVPVHLAWTLP